MSRRTRTIRQVAKSLGLVAILLGLTAAPAAAAPSLGVELERDSADFPTVSHSDERADYTVKVKNTAPLPLGPPEVGSELICKRGEWFREAQTNYSFTYQWVRNGVALESTEDVAHGSQTNTYTVQSGDAETALQCVVKGTNGAGTGSFVGVSKPVAVVNPPPTVEPPKPNEAPNELPPFASRPAISGSAKNAGEELICTAPTFWSGSPSWTFAWLRNGVPAVAGAVTETTATTSKFKIAASELATKAEFQCMGTATNAGGAALERSQAVKTESPAPGFVEQTSDGVPIEGYDGSRVEIVSASTIGTVTLELELPGGDETYAFRAEGVGWTCDKTPPSGAQHAIVTCTDASVLSPGESFNPVTVATALGADAPDTAVAKATVLGGGAPAVSDEDEFHFEPAIPFGLSAFEARVSDPEGHDYTQAGGHGFVAEATLTLAKKRRLGPATEQQLGPITERAKYAPIEQLRQVFTDLPPGFVGSVAAIPQLCPSVEDVLVGTCPAGSEVGEAVLAFGEGSLFTPSIWALKPEFGAPIQFGIVDPFGDVYIITPHLRPDDGYAVTLVAAPVPSLDLLEAQVRLCDFGVKTPSGSSFACHEAGEVGANPKPLFTNPTRCGESPVTRVRLNSWPHPDHFAESVFTNAAITGCNALQFEPTLKARPTTNLSDSPSGLEVDLHLPQNDDPEGKAEAHLKDSVVTLPEGLVVNPAAANGLGACSEAQLGMSGGVPNGDPVACPDSSKLGSAEVDTPLLDHTLKGSVYIAAPHDNPFDSLLAIYLVIDDPQTGTLVKLAGHVEADPQSGRLTTTVDDNPQFPFEDLKLHFKSGAAAPLRTPALCGTYSTTSVLTPWSAPDSGPPATPSDAWSIDQSPSGGDCPSAAGAQPNSPSFKAGSVSPIAAAYSPFVLHLRREDGSQNFAALSVNPPPGLVAKLAGTQSCPDAALAAAAQKSGAAEKAAPSCPAASRVGSVIAGAGAGPSPYYAPGSAYLSGPYKGAPLSLAIITPATAGPFDLGTIVVRTALYVDPATARIKAVSDPIPHILQGIPLDLRTVDVSLDRPEFMLNGTSCDPLAVAGLLTSTLGQTAALSSRFQLGECTSLGFKPSMKLSLKGGTTRGKHPALTAVLQPRAGDANLASISVALPHSEFLEQAHIRTICTRVQWAADACPAAAIYGTATVTTPLLDYPLSGPVYLRSSDNPLPDLVPDLRGPAYQPIRLEAAGRTDSIHGGIRNSFAFVPDAPFTKLVLSLQGGNRGLLVNSRDICAKPYKVTVNYGAHNGLTYTAHPALRAKCPKGGKTHKGHHRKAHRGQR